MCACTLYASSTHEPANRNEGDSDALDEGQMPETVGDGSQHTLQLTG